MPHGGVPLTSTLSQMNIGIILLGFAIAVGSIQAKEPGEMTILELESYLLPPVGTDRSKVEEYFGYACSETEANSGKKRIVFGYLLFLPVLLDVVYADDKVVERSFHHRENIADWNSEYFFDIAIALRDPDKADRAAKTKRWIISGYLHFIEGN